MVGLEPTAGGVRIVRTPVRQEERPQPRCATRAKAPEHVSLMDVWGDLKSAKLMYLKAILFLVAGTASAAGILLENPHWRTALMLGIAIWAFCRLYYFAFYVIEKYIDSSYRFAGIGSFLLYLLRKGTRD
jgi:hypothetical protein